MAEVTKYSHDEIAKISIKPKPKKKNSLQEYLNNDYKKITRKNSTKFLNEYKKIQREIIDETNKLFRAKQYLYEIELNVFVPAKIEHVENFCEIYVVQSSHLEMQKTVQDELKMFYESKITEPFNEILIGDICAVCHENVWYRGEVVNIITLNATNQKRYFIHLLDFGKTIRLQSHRIRLLKGWLVQLGALAIKCSLVELDKDIREFDQNKKLKMLNTLKNAAMNAKNTLVYVKNLIEDRIHNQFITEIYLLTDYETDIDTIHDAYLLHEYYAAFVRQKIQFNETIYKFWLNTDMKNAAKPLKQMSQFKEKTCVKISHLVSPLEFFVRFERQEKSVAKLRSKIDEYIEKYVKNEDETIIFKENDCCLVRSNDKCWHRGRIYLVQKNSYSVFMRDYGKKIKVAKFNVKPISTELAAVPDLIQRCSLVTWLPTNYADFNKAIKEYKSFSISAIVESYDTRESIGVTLWGANSEPYIYDDKLWQNIGAKIISQAIVNALEMFIEKSLYFFKSDCKSDISFDHIFKLRKTIEGYKSCEVTNQIYRIVDIWLPPIRQWRLIFTAIITHLNDTGDIFLQVHEDYDTIVSINEWINSNILNQPIDKETDGIVWASNDPCFAKSNQDNLYYRASIISVNPDSDNILVQFLDYGNTEYIKAENLQFATNFSDIPSLLHQYYTPNIIAITDKWDKNILAECREKLIGKWCVVRVKHNENNNLKIVPCEITLLDDQLTLSDWMIINQLYVDFGKDPTGKLILYV